MSTKNIISWEDFNKVDIRIGTIIEVLDFPKARNPSYQLTIDFGQPIGVLKTAAQITVLYSKEALIGKQILAIVNFPKKQIANFMSECLVLGAVKEKTVYLLKPEDAVSNGLLIS